MIFYSDKDKPYQNPEAKSIRSLLKLRGKNNGDNIAIAAPGRSHLTFGQLLEQVEDTVKVLRSFGLNRNDRVAIVLPNGPEMAVAFLAVAAGATCAPLNPSYRANEFDFYLSDLNAKALIVHSELDSPAREVSKKHNIPIIELTSIKDKEAGTFALIGNSEATNSNDGLANPDDTALVLHTSGTTSRPKIVPLTQRNICTLLIISVYHWN